MDDGSVLGWLKCQSHLCPPTVKATHSSYESLLNYISELPPMDYTYLLPLGAAASAVATGLVWYRFFRNPFATLNGTA